MRHILRPSLAVAALVACRDATAPLPSVLDGRAFAAVAVAGVPLPTVLDTWQGDTTFLVADSVWFFRGGRARRVQRFLRRGVHGTAPDSSRRDVEFRVTGERVSIGFFGPCPPGALCIPNEVGPFGRDTLALAYEELPPPPARSYREIVAR